MKINNLLPMKKLSYSEKFRIMDALKDFIKQYKNTKIIIFPEFKNKTVILYSNYPGYLIGKAGCNIDKLSVLIKNLSNKKITKVKIKEMTYLVSN